MNIDIRTLAISMSLTNVLQVTILTGVLRSIGRRETRITITTGLVCLRNKTLDAFLIRVAQHLTGRDDITHEG
jgi:hypothetical protein